MKFVDCEHLSIFNCLLDGIDGGNCYVYGKIELYLCSEQTKEEIQLAKDIEINLERLKPKAKETISPTKSKGIPIKNRNRSSSIFSSSTYTKDDKTTFSSSPNVPLSSSAPSKPQSNSIAPFGSMSCPSNRKHFVNLISVLNLSYPDYDFRTIKPEQFVRQRSFESVYSNVNFNIANILDADYRMKLWRTCEHIMEGFNNCEIYTYVSEDDDDPFTLCNGRLWNMNYIFYNKKKGSALLFTAYAKSKAALMRVNSAMDYDSDYDTFYSNPKNRYVHYSQREYSDGSDDLISEDEW